MRTFQFRDNDGKIQDVIFAIDLVEAIDFASKRELGPTNIVDLGPTSLSAWASWLEEAA